MEMRRLDVTHLECTDIMSLLKLYRGVSVFCPVWADLQELMVRYQVWGFCSQGALVGFAWLAPARCPIDRTIQLVKLRYHWRYNTEESITHMISAIKRAYQEDFDYLLLDIDSQHEVNLGLFLRLGFSKAIFCSPKGKDFSIYLADLRSCP